jgi:hypothetical protein
MQIEHYPSIIIGPGGGVGDKNKVIGIPALPNIQPNRIFIFYFFKKRPHGRQMKEWKVPFVVL